MVRVASGFAQRSIQSGKDMKVGLVIKKRDGVVIIMGVLQIPGVEEMAIGTVCFL